MAHLMLGLERALRRRRWLVLGAWLAAVVVAVPFAARQNEHLTGGGYGVPGSQSDTVARALDRFGDAGRAGALAAVVRDGADLERLQAATRPAPGVTLTRAAKERTLAALRHKPRRAVVVALDVRPTGPDAIDEARDLRERLGGRVALVGQGALWAGLQERSKHDMEAAERAGFPVVALVLLLVFGSLAAASLPLALGAVSVTVTGALIFFLSRAMDMSVFVTNMASMIGIGVAVDYSLFVLARYREEVRAGVPPATARGRALATSGLAVAFSGATVMVSLAGLFLVDTTAMRSMALGAILVVAVSVLAAATLLPVLMGALGHRVYARGRLFSALDRVVRSRRPRRRGSSRGEHLGFWRAWTDRVMARPALSALFAVVVLAALALPALWLHTGNGALRQLPAGDATRQGFEAAQAVTGAGASAPLRILATPRHGELDAGALRALRASLARDPEIARVGPPVRAGDGRAALLTAVPRHDGESDEAKALVARLRAQTARDGALRVDVGGASATQVDFHDRISGSMWKIVLFVLVLSYVVLLVLLRSAILPLKAALMNLLSVGAAYGVMVAAFQWGWLEWAGIERTGFTDAITPPLILAVVFGLSMDYEVFLLTRIRERFAATGDTRRAVAEGLASSARTITSAALIMVGVFAVFALTGLPAIQQLGLGTAVAVAIDATLVRLVLVPAAMGLLGRWNWWLPRPLARVLPRADFEGLPAAASGD